MKKKLAIDIDEILRAKWLAFDKYYEMEFGEDGIKGPFNTYNYMNHYDFIEKEETVNVLTEDFLKDDDLKNLSPKEYITDPETGKAPVDAFAFKSEKKTLSPQEQFDRFLYNDFVYEIHGSAPKIYVNADVDLLKFMKIYEQYFDFVIFSKTKKEAISSTLFFLSKMRLEIKNILFVYDDNEIWNQVDWVMTTDPSIITSKPIDKTVIKMERLYNEEVKGDYTSMSIMELNEQGTTESPNMFLEFVKNKIKK